MISNGILPSNKKEIATDNKVKRLDLRRHGNITTFEGLINYQYLIVKIMT
jgi:hypothetical protein